MPFRRVRTADLEMTTLTAQMLDFEKLKKDVLLWLDSLKVPGSSCRYKFHANADDTIFCSCFALFILDLFRETEKFTQQERQAWISHIRSFQDDKYGYFEPEDYYHQDKERNRHQLTCFCLSALGILGVEPESPLSFVQQWKTPDDVRRYLYDRGCHEGRPGSGNKAMFLAIFLTYEYERTGETHLLDKIDAWFEFHDQAQNENGFWGKDRRSQFFHGLQNGFHQLLVYFYWNRPINRLGTIVDVALRLRDREGFFSPVCSGWPCYDYDAIHVLVNAYHLLDYKRAEITKSLKRAFYAMARIQNEDGGFCQSKRNADGTRDLMKSLLFYIYGKNPYIWYYRLRKSLGTTTRKRSSITTGWTKNGRAWDESNLWDTWFRCLSLAEITKTIELKDAPGLKKTQFHRVLGLGFNGRRK